MNPCRRASTLRQLNRLQLLIVEIACAGFHLRHQIRVTPWPIRLGLVHTLSTFATLLALPPAGELPPIAVPLAWATSFCIAFITCTIFPLIRV